jgi:exoribonuclease-2
MNDVVVALPRRDRVVLALLVSEDRGPGGEARVTVVAEDGARFALPADQVFARFPGALGSHREGAPHDRLRKLRGAVERALRWADVHAALPQGQVVDFDAVAAAAGASDEAGRLRVALALGSAEPWLRRTAGGWAVVPRDEAASRIAAAEAARRAEREDESLRTWWPRRSTEARPAACEGAVEALRRFGLHGDGPSTERGRLLAARLDVPEPDHVVEALVACRILPADVNPAPWRAGLAEPFPTAAIDEARRLAAAPPGGAREDLTSLHTVSVDDEETTEVDDAISVRLLDGDVEILVHISDAADAVPPGGPLDDAARARASSLYVPEATVTMLPAELVAGRASLDQGVVRPAVTGAFRVRLADGAVVASRFFRSLVRVTRRLDYEQTRDGAALAADPETAALLVTAAQRLREARVRDGAVVTHLPSLKIRVVDGAPRIERRLQDTAGDLVVAETAVLYNSEAGRLLAARDVAALFRTQEPLRGPQPDPADPMWPVLVRRRFAPTHLRVEPLRHHGVGRDAYAQATSPMRRYADLVNQRQLLAVATGEAPPYRPGDLEVLAQHVSERERAVRRASGAREDHWLARWVLDRGLAELDGVLARAPRRGFGSVWVDELLSEVTLRAPDRWKSPPEGTRALWRVERVLPWRGRIEVAPKG